MTKLTGRVTLFILPLIIGCAYLYFTSLPSEYRNKKWAHRVNSLERLDHIAAKYPGVEFDAIFRDSIFDIHHPPAKSIGLTLDTLLSQSKKHEHLQFWIDFKNLDSTNVHASLSKLTYLCTKYGLESSSFIVESNKPEFLDEFVKVGFRTSYYLPQNLDKISAEKRNRKLANIKTKINLTSPHYVSTAIQDYELIKDDFPNMKMILWANRKEVFFRRIKLSKISADPSVEIILYPQMLHINYR